MKTFLKNVSLVAVTNKDITASINALKYSSKKIIFKSILLLSPMPSKRINKSIKNIQIKELNNIGEWGEFITFELHKYIQTDYIILIHPDGFIVNPHLWSSSFLDYDFIGAPWPDVKEFYDQKGVSCRVGNSVSLRSHKFLSIPTAINLKWNDAAKSNFHEDGFLCVQNREKLEKNGIKFADLNTAYHFSREYSLKENKKIEPFAFHKWHGKNKKYPRLGNRKTLKEFFKDIYLSIKYK